MKWVVKVVPLAAAVLLLGTAAAAAQPPGQAQGAAKGPAAGKPRGPWAHPMFGHFGGLHPERALRLADRFGLEGDVRSKVVALVDKTRKLDSEIVAKLDKARLELKGALHAATPDREAIMKLADRLSALRTELHKLHLALRLDVESVLPADVRERWRAAVDEPRPMKRGPGPRRGGGRPR